MANSLKTKKQKVNKKAVAVAKDVIKQLKSLKLNRNYYITARGLNANEEFPTKADLQDCVDQVQETCYVCQTGALLLSKARLYNATPMNDICWVINSHDSYCRDIAEKIRELLSDVFERETIDLLEVAFEQTAYPWTHNAYDDITTAALKFGKKYKTLHGCVKGCMLNIIKNGGYFKPWLK